VILDKTSALPSNCGDIGYLWRYVIGSRKLEKNSKFFCAQRMEKRPTDLKALFLHKVLSNEDTLYPLVVF
jgi:hypothetical protein